MKAFRQISAAVMSLALCGIYACSSENISDDEPMKPVVNSPDDGRDRGGYQSPDKFRFTPQSTVADVIGDQCFGDFGRLLFPVDRNVSPTMTLAQVSTSGVYLWYPYIRVEKTVEILNHLRSEALAGHKIFHRIYTAGETAADPSKADTGIFVFHGEAGRPFAVTSAGGGFAYVGAMHDSFPHSLEISRAGYTAFALIYRPDDPYSDLARAITYIRDNAEELGVAKDDYSLWGGSAGARMAATLGNKAYLDLITGTTHTPQAAAVIMQYTGYSTASELDAPTYSCVGTDDGIASWRIMQNRLQRLSAMGIPTEFHVYEGLGHGFGIGTGTVAEGWTDDAIRFWESNMKNPGNTAVTPVRPD